MYGDRLRYDDRPAPDPARCFDCPPVDPAPAVQWSNLSNLIIVVCLSLTNSISCVVGLFPIRPSNAFVPQRRRAWALPSLRAMAKVSISSLVVVGVKEILKSGKLYDESVDMQVVIKSAMDKAAAQAERSLCFVKAEAFASVRTSRWSGAAPSWTRTTCPT